MVSLWRTAFSYWVLAVVFAATNDSERNNDYAANCTELWEWSNGRVNDL
jgi:hypothetical protein